MRHTPKELKATGKSTSQKPASRRRTADAGAEAKALAALGDIADTLCRVAEASWTRHRRYAELVEHGAPDGEQKAARSAARESNELLDEAVDLYEFACLDESSHADDAWWHRANMVWRSAREYLRHSDLSDSMSRCGNGHGKAELRELSIEYELAASALLRLRHSLDSYRAVRPEAS